MSLAAVVLGVLAPALWLGSWSIEHRRDALDDMIRQARQHGEELHEMAAADGVEGVDRLAAISFEHFQDPDVWRAVTALDREGYVMEALRNAVMGVSAGLEPERAPRLSALVTEPPVRWDRDAETWAREPGFQDAGAAVGAYHHHMARLLGELETDRPELSAPLEQARTRARRVTEELAASWADRWLAEPQASLGEVLTASVIEGDGDAFPPAALWRWMTLPLDGASEVARQAPGCHLRAYEEDANAYRRLDCYTYAPAGETLGARLRLEMRLVYLQPMDRRMSPGLLPVEIYFLFPVPPETPAEVYRDRVAAHLAEATREHWTGEFQAADRAGSLHQGFSLMEDSAKLRIYRPRLIPFVDDTQAVEIRGEWGQEPRNFRGGRR